MRGCFNYVLQATPNLSLSRWSSHLPGMQAKGLSAHLCEPIKKLELLKRDHLKLMHHREIDERFQ